MGIESLAAVNASAAAWDSRDAAAAAALLRRHAAAREACGSSSKRRQTLSSGGWCLRTMAADSLFGAERSVRLSGGRSFTMPAAHVEADEFILEGLVELAAAARGGALSINDFGAGVGQYGHALSERAPRVRYRGFDGAGDVEAYTRGFVSFIDLTMPLALPRADWVVSLEVGEHVPREHELMLIRNLHAHNCRGVLLSWACYGGHQHVNRRSNEHVMAAFAELGYVHNHAAARKMRRPAQRARLEANRSNRVYGWFARSVMVFERVTPLRGRGCNA